MGIFEKIMKEREEDEVLRKSELNGPIEVKKIEEDLLEGDYPTGISVTMEDQSKDSYKPEGIVSTEIKDEDGKIIVKSYNYKSSEQQVKDEGLSLSKRYGLVKCNFQPHKHAMPCNGLILVRNGQKTATCPKCRRRRTLDSEKTRLVDQADSREVLITKKTRLKTTDSRYK